MKRLSILPVFILLFAITAGCDNQGPVESAGETVDETVEDVGNAIEDACEDIKDKAGAKDKDC